MIIFFQRNESLFWHQNFVLVGSSETQIFLYLAYGDAFTFFSTFVTTLPASLKDLLIFFPRFIYTECWFYGVGMKTLLQTYLKIYCDPFSKKICVSLMFNIVVSAVITQQ